MKRASLLKLQVLCNSCLLHNFSPLIGSSQHRFDIYNSFSSVTVQFVSVKLALVRLHHEGFLVLITWPRV